MLYKKTNSSLWVLGLLLLVLFYGCYPEQRPEGENTLEYFVQQQGPAVYINGVPVFRYAEYESQVACNLGRKMLRFQTNNQETYVQMTFSVLPGVLENGSLGVALTYTEVSGEPKSLRAVLEVVKQEGGLYWCWDEKGKIGIILPDDWELFFKIKDPA